MTQIFNTYADFAVREDRKVNGVSPEFAEANPNWESDNASNEGCWNCRSCSYCRSCSDCSYCSDCRSCSYCSSCSYCRSCSDCSYCSDCRSCSYCSYCSYCRSCSDCRSCSYCSDKIKNTESFDAPVIPNIHQAVLDAASGEGALNMADWHTCDTTHCRAGWVVFLAGEAGLDLEKRTSTLFAALMIYKASSPIKVSPTRFFESNAVAMKDMVRCAEEEKAMEIAS